MPLSFYTHPQQMVFADPAGNEQDPEGLTPNTWYDVYIVIQNADPIERHGVQVTVTHSAFGIGYPSGTIGIVEPDPVDVPPEAYGLAGLETVHFRFLVPAAGHGRLTACFDDAGTTQCLSQNISALGAPAGTTADFSFLVFGDPTTPGSPVSIALVLTELEGGVGGSPVDPANSWHPSLITPSELSVTGGPFPALVTLDAVPPRSVYSLGLEVNIPPNTTDTHDFRIVGWEGGVGTGRYVG